jgi:hypothetical protein
VKNVKGKSHSNARNFTVRTYLCYYRATEEGDFGWIQKTAEHVKLVLVRYNGNGTVSRERVFNSFKDRENG